MDVGKYRLNIGIDMAVNSAGTGVRLKVAVTTGDGVKTLLFGFIRDSLESQAYPPRNIGT